MVLKPAQQVIDSAQNFSLKVKDKCNIGKNSSAKSKFTEVSYYLYNVRKKFAETSK